MIQYIITRSTVSHEAVTATKTPEVASKRYYWLYTFCATGVAAVGHVSNYSFICMCGDFNARTGDLCDCVEDDF